MSSRARFWGPPRNAGLSGFAPFTHDLGPWAGQTVRLRWPLTSDGGVENEDFVLDDVRVDAPGECQGGVAGAPDVRANPLRPERDPGRDILAWWAWLDPAGSGTSTRRRIRSASARRGRT